MLHSDIIPERSCDGELVSPEDEPSFKSSFLLVFSRLCGKWSFASMNDHLNEVKGQKPPASGDSRPLSFSILLHSQPCYLI